MNFFTADLHLATLERIRINQLPFHNANAYVKTIVGNINESCSKDDILHSIGDFVDYDPNCPNTEWLEHMSIVERIRPRVIMITGNNEERIIHDHFDSDFEAFKSTALGLGFADVLRREPVVMRNMHFEAIHKPWDGTPNVMLLHGHLHYMTAYTRHGLNVGVYQSFMYPVSEDMIFDRIFKLVDYHDGYEYVYNEEFDYGFWQNYCVGENPIH